MDFRLTETHQLRSLLILVIAYLIGSIPSGYLIVLTKEGADVRDTGSGGTGATNVSRSAGKGAGIITLILDAMKGALAVFLASKLTIDLYPYIDWTVAASAVLVIVGHIFPVWLKFRGGKGVATGLGAFFMLVPGVGFIAVMVFVITFLFTRYVSLASMVSVAAIAITMCVMTLADPLWLPFTVASLVAAALIIFAHRENIQRLRAGTEPKFK
jgi:acyl phosphate:glycerol-3-phosphate acyltransferase